MQEGYSDSPGLPQYALVLGTSNGFILDTTVSSNAEESELKPSMEALQGPPKSESVHLASRTMAFKEQGFSYRMVARTEDHQKRLAKAVYKAKLAFCI